MSLPEIRARIEQLRRQAEQRRIGYKAIEVADKSYDSIHSGYRNADGESIGPIVFRRKEIEILVNKRAKRDTPSRILIKVAGEIVYEQGEIIESYFPGDWETMLDELYNDVRNNEEGTIAALRKRFPV